MRYYSHFSILAFPIPNERVSEHVHEILVKQEEGDRTQWGDKTKWNLIRKTTKEKKKKENRGETIVEGRFREYKTIDDTLVGELN